MDVFAQFEYLPPALLAEAGALGLGIELSLGWATLNANVALLGLILLAAAPSQPIRFEQFVVSETFAGETIPPNLASHPRARTYRTVLRKEAKSGPNFAGHFTIVRIGAGTGTILLAVVGALSGAVYFPKHPTLISWAGWWHGPYGPVYRIDSRLLIVYGQSGSEDAPYGIS